MFCQKKRIKWIIHVSHFLAENCHFTAIKLQDIAINIMFTGSGDYHVPSRLALDDCGVTEAGPTEQIESLCSKVQELDMSKNRVTDWLQVLPVKYFPVSVVCCFC